MVKQNLKFTSLVLVLALTLVGCSIREAPLPSNAPPPAQKPGPNSSGQEDVHLSHGDSPELKRLDLAKPQTLESLAALVLDPAVYRNRDASESVRFFEALREFHLQLLRIPPAALAAPLAETPEAKILARYKDIILTNCEDLTGTCENLAVFGRETHFTQVLEMMANHEPKVLGYYRLLRVAMERFHPADDQVLDMMYLSRSQELVAYYRTDKVHSKQQILAALSVHSRLFQNVLAEFNAETAPKEQLDLIMKNFEPFKLSRNDRESVTTDGIEKLLAMAASHYLYADAEKTTLNADFVKEVNSILDSHQDKGAMGLRAIFKDIKDNDSRNILTNFGLVPNLSSDPFKADEYTYLVDRLYYSHFSADDAANFWAHTGQDKKRLFQAINQFVRIQIAYMIVLTNQRMNDFFAGSGDRFKDPFSLLAGAIDNSLAAHADWDRTLNTRIAAVSHFVDRLYGAADPFSLASDDPYKAFQDSVTGLQNNIKMLSVYPNMMMLVYLMAKQNLSGTISTFWGDFTITAYDVIRVFFVSVMDPWFNFGTDNSKLTRIELLYAMHFALQTETFSAYKQNKMVSVSEGDFLTEVINKFMNKDLQDLKDRMRKMSEFLQSNQELSAQAMAACREEKDLQPIDEQTGVIQPRSYTRVFNYTDLQAQLANGFASPAGNQLGVMTNFYASLQLVPYLLSVRTDLEERLLFIRNMSSIISDYLREHGVDESKAEAAYLREIADITSVRDELLKTTHRTLKTYNGCDVLLYKHEVAMRTKVFQMEEDYLGEVYDRLLEMNRLKANGGADAEIEKANQAIARQESGLPGEYIRKGGYDKYLKGNSIYYTYNQLDALLRVRDHVKKLAPQTEITLPNFDKLGEFQNPTPYFLDIGKEAGDPQVRRQAFIDSGMRHFVQWMEVNNHGLTPTFLINKINLMAQLYRIGPVDANGKPGCVGPDCTRITPDQIIRETLETEKLAQLSDYDLKILGWTGAEAVHDDDFWSELVMESGTRRHLGLLDTTFQRIATDSLGSATGKPDEPDVSSSISSHFLELTKSYFDTESSVGTFFFAPRPSVKSAIRENYQAYVSDYEDKVNEFMVAYEKARRDPSLRITEIKRARRDTVTVPVDAEGLPIYIFEDRRSRLEGLLNTFHERTSFEFKKTKP